ncbi:MAG: hypothetical protein M3P51_09680, partial [Chloroflexota bacterium]|nr:hypothetical protein [Chloroflexota bacterium]
MTPEELKRLLEEFGQKAATLQERMKGADGSQLEELKGQLDEIKKGVQPLVIEKQKHDEEERRKGLE